MTAGHGDHGDYRCSSTLKSLEREASEEDKEQWGLLEKSFSGTAGQKGPDHHLEAGPKCAEQRGVIFI